MFVIKNDEYTMISTFIHFGRQNLSSLQLCDSIIVITLLVLKNNYRCKHNFKSTLHTKTNCNSDL